MFRQSIVADIIHAVTFCSLRLVAIYAMLPPLQRGKVTKKN